MKKNMSDPRIGNIHLDANALEPPDPHDEKLVAKFLRLRDEGVICVVNPKGVQNEIEHVNTPATTKKDMEGVYTIATNRTHEEDKVLNGLQRLLQGKGQSAKHDADADHLFEAEKNGGRYFITHDRRILNNRAQIAELLGNGFKVLSLREFIDVCNKFGLGCD